MHQIQMKEVFRKPFFILFAVGSLLSLIVSQVCIFLATEYGINVYASMYAIFLLVKYWVYICIALTIFAYLCLADSHTRDVDETIAAYKGGKYYQRFCVKYFIAGAVVLQLLMLALYWFAFRTMIFYGLFQFLVVDQSVAIDAIRDKMIVFTGHIDRRTMAQMTTLRQIHAHHSIAKI